MNTTNHTLPAVGARIGVVYGPGEFAGHNAGIVIAHAENQWGAWAVVLMDDGSCKRCDQLNKGPGIGWHAVQRAAAPVAPVAAAEIPAPALAVFEAGKTYSTRSICDHDSIISLTIAKRTAKTVTTTTGKTLRIAIYDGAEYVMPWGRYSMAPSVRAR